MRFSGGVDSGSTRNSGTTIGRHLSRIRENSSQSARRIDRPSSKKVRGTGRSDPRFAQERRPMHEIVKTTAQYVAYILEGVE